MIRTRARVDASIGGAEKPAGMGHRNLGMAMPIGTAKNGTATPIRFWPSSFCGQGWRVQL